MKYKHGYIFRFVVIVSSILVDLCNAWVYLCPITLKFDISLSSTAELFYDFNKPILEHQDFAKICNNWHDDEI